MTTLILREAAYQGWQHALYMSNGAVELWIPLEIGIRVLHCGLHGGENMLGVLAQDMGASGGEAWRNYGGHRLWHAPEAKPRTYSLDNFPITYQEVEQGVRLVQPVDGAGIQKSITITLDEANPKVHLRHELLNHTAWDVTLAAWALTVMARGGHAIVPLGLDTAHTDDTLTPRSTLALWGYTRLNDARLKFGAKYLFVQQDPRQTAPQKLGLYNASGWCAYWRNGLLFVKRFAVNQPPAAYPDYGSTFEVFVDHNILELETLAPLITLPPQGVTTHEETWQLFDGLPALSNDDEVDAHLLPHLL